MQKKKIKPLRQFCDCKSVVINHHYLCDKCWGKKQKNKIREYRRKLVISSIKRRVNK